MKMDKFIMCHLILSARLHVMGTSFLLLYAGNSFAHQSKNPFSADAFSVDMSVGVLQGKANEFVYDAGSGNKQSQLKWKLNNVAILKAGVTWEPIPRMSMNVNGWTSIAQGSGHMDDYDWQDPAQSHWTDHSSELTRVNYANKYDVNATGWFFTNALFRLGLMAGYEESRYSWTTHGGYYDYNNGAYKGNFPLNVDGIGYSQKFTAPYIGLSSEYTNGNFKISALLKYSHWVHAHDRDEHYARHLSFWEKTGPSSMYGLTLNSAFYITKNTQVYTELDYTKYSEGKGWSSDLDRETGEFEHASGDAAGISNENLVMSAGLKYTF